MKREECIIGAEVYTCDGINYRYIVTALPDEKDIVEVKPTNKSYGESDSFHLEDLYLYDMERVKQAGVELQAKIDTAKNAFETAFEALQQLRDLEVQDGISMYDLGEAGYLSLKELEDTVDRGGWNSSSLWC